MTEPYFEAVTIAMTETDDPDLCGLAYSCIDERYGQIAEEISRNVGPLELSSAIFFAPRSAIVVGRFVLVHKSDDVAHVNQTNPNKPK